MPPKSTVLIPPSLHNSSCSHLRFSQASLLEVISFGGVLEAVIILLLTFGVLIANILLILVINSRRYSKYIHSQVGREKKQK